jgi:general secretion pathway protein C
MPIPHLLQRYSLQIYSFVIVIAIIFTGLRAYSFWQDFNNSKLSVTFQQVQPADQATRRSPSELVSLHMFGRPPTIVVPPPEEQADLPETRLKLTLRGVSAAAVDRYETEKTGPDYPRERASGALVEGPDRVTEFFRIGANLPGNARLHAVYANRIVIDRKGKLENLSFPEDSDMSAGFENFDSSSVENEAADNNEESDQIEENSEANNPEQMLIQNSQFEDSGMTDPANQEPEQLTEQDPESGSLESSENRQEQIKSRLQRLREQIRQQRAQ